MLTEAHPVEEWPPAKYEQLLIISTDQNLTNMSPMRLVHTTRMKRAAQLLQNGSYAISEVAYKVGFSDTRYFSTCFKKEFDVIPTEYRRKNKENFTNKEP